MQNANGGVEMDKIVSQEEWEILVKTLASQERINDIVKKRLDLIDRAAEENTND